MRYTIERVVVHHVQSAESALLPGVACMLSNAKREQDLGESLEDVLFGEIRRARRRETPLIEILRKYLLLSVVQRELYQRAVPVSDRARVT